MNDDDLSDEVKQEQIDALERCQDCDSTDVVVDEFGTQTFFCCYGCGTMIPFD